MFFCNELMNLGLEKYSCLDEGDFGPELQINMLVKLNERDKPSPLKSSNLPLKMIRKSPLHS